MIKDSRNKLNMNHTTGDNNQDIFWDPVTIKVVKTRVSAA